MAAFDRFCNEDFRRTGRASLHASRGSRSDPEIARTDPRPPGPRETKTQPRYHRGRSLYADEVYDGPSTAISTFAGRAADRGRSPVRAAADHRRSRRDGRRGSALVERLEAALPAVRA